MAPRTATEAAKRSSEEKTRRHREGVKLNAEVLFVNINLRARVELISGRLTDTEFAFVH